MLKTYWYYPVGSALVFYIEVIGPSVLHFFLLVYWAGVTVVGIAIVELLAWGIRTLAARCSRGH